MGFYNRRYLTAAVQAGDVKAKQRLRRIIGFEGLAVLAVFLAVAYWRLSPPPRALLADTASVIVVEDVKGNVQAQIKLNATPPNMAETVTVYLTKNNKAFAAQEVSVVFSSPEAQIEAIKFATSQTDKPGLWQIEGFKLPEASSWEVQVKVLVSDFERLILKTAF